jgi:hypothetical protein
MSHNCGPIVPVGSRIGPDSGATATAPGVWEFLLTPQPAATGGRPRFVILHFVNLQFPGASRLEVDVRYGTDTFTGASGADGWTRPIDPVPGPIRIRYFGSGTNGGVTLSEYGSGEPTVTGTPGTTNGSRTNVDLFLHTNPYVEPIYETRLKCGVFDWQNIACAASGSVEASAAKAVCCFVCVHRHDDGTRSVSTCTGTLIDENLVLMAQHCAREADDLEARSGSVCFGYETTCPGGRPSGYAAKIFKVTRTVRRGTADWAVLEIETPPGGTGIAPAQLRAAAAQLNENVIAIHHPHGAVKKFQKGILDSSGVAPVDNFDFAGGSSGSALFDSMGRIVGGALSYGPAPDACHAVYVPAATIVQELANPPAPPAPFDVMLVLDRSGSMSGPGLLPGRTKMQEARDAASLFVQLVRAGAGHRVGLVSFSTTAGKPPDSELGNVDAAKKSELVGPAPYTAGKVGGLNPNGMTSIGDGLLVAIGALVPGANQRRILLMTDGLQNTPPMIADVEAGLGTTKLVAIGFGAESDLDSALLSRVARAHNGLYTRANDGLELKKFFSLAFGNIFEVGALSDPELELREGLWATDDFPFDVCDEDRITAIVGWDKPSQALALELTTPGGGSVTVGSPGVEADLGDTWQFIRVPLPHQGQREGTWQWKVHRLGGGGEFPPPAEPVRLFVTVIADGGPRLEALPGPTRLYTGDPLRPLIALRYENGSAPHADVKLEIEAPNTAIGAIVAGAGLSPPEVGDDPLSAFHATLKKIGGGQPYRLPTRMEFAELFDDGEHGDGAMEPDGVYANELHDMTRFEGTYRMRAIATYTTTCTGRREAQWAVQVSLGIDRDRTTVELKERGPAPGGGRQGVIVITPRDRYGSPLGPGRGEEVEFSGGYGTDVTGWTDNGDGSYDVDVTWNPDVPGGPSVSVEQPDRPPVVVGPGVTPGRACPRWLWWLLLLLLLLLLLAVIVIVVLAL